MSCEFTISVESSATKREHKAKNRWKQPCGVASRLYRINGMVTTRLCMKHHQQMVQRMPSNTKWEDLS